jgi:hypothetical protein
VNLRPDVKHNRRACRPGEIFETGPLIAAGIPCCARDAGFSQCPSRNEDFFVSYGGRPI